MKEEKKYRIICETAEEHSILKSIYPKMYKRYRKDYYYVSWDYGSLHATAFEPTHSHPEIKPISFKEWELDYRKNHKDLFDYKLEHNRWEVID